MTYHAGIDLHANNSVLVVADEQDRAVYEKRLRNELPLILDALAPYRLGLQAIAVESTYNWYWLVDGLMDAGYTVYLANSAALPQYSGLKHTDDQHDARWLAHLLRLGILPTGYIYPKTERPVRDLLRKRGQLVRQKTAIVLSLQSLLARLTGARYSMPRLRQLLTQDLSALLPAPEYARAATSSGTVLRCVEAQIAELEAAVLARVQLRPAFRLLQTVTGIGEILALTIMLETGAISRFAAVGHFASYCRCVSSRHLSNGKLKGRGNVKNGNKYLAWAFLEAAHFAVRFDPVVKRFYQRKAARTHEFVALKAVAHKLARACYYMMRDQVPFDVRRAFA